MPYNEKLEKRISALIGSETGLTAKKMFGGVGFLLHGNMACGVHKDALIVRVGPDNYQAALDRPATSVFDITGRPMTGWVMVAADSLESDAALEEWTKQGVAFARSLPPK